MKQLFINKNMRLGFALMTATVMSTAFQLVILSAAAQYGGSAEVGRVTLSNALATVLVATVLSDAKSLATTRLSAGMSLTTLILLRRYAAFAMALIAVISIVLTHSSVLSCFIALRTVQSYCDVNTAIWQNDGRPMKVMAFNFARYSVGALLLLVGIWLGGGFDLVFALAVFYIFMTALAETALTRRLLNANIHSQKPSHLDPDLKKAYLSLSFAGFLNFFPQSILRYWILRFADISTVGNFSIQYQLIMLPVPLITAFSQVALGRDKPTFEHFKNDLIMLIVGSSIICIVMGGIFLTSANIFVNIIFPDFSSIGVLETILILPAAMFIYLSVYLGFYSIKIGLHTSQLKGGVVFVTVISLVCGAAGYAYGLLGIINGLLLGSALRCLLQMLDVMRYYRR